MAGFKALPSECRNGDRSGHGDTPCGDCGTVGQLPLGEIAADFAQREADLACRARAAGLTRREFLAALAAGTAALTCTLRAETSPPPAAPSPLREQRGSPAAPAPSPAAPAARSRVVVVTHPEVVIKEYRVNPPVIRQMLDRALVELSGSRTEAEAWQKVARADDFVAVKHNSIGRPTLHSHTEINDAVAAQLAAAAQVKPDRILAADRLLPAPYNELSDPFTLPSRGLETRLRRLYTEQATAIVNVSVLKAHYSDGLSAALKNHLGSVNNPAAYHGWEPDRMPRSIPELNALPPLRSKTRLAIIDAIRPLFAGGPVDDPQYRWDYRGLIVSTDPVAAEAVGLRLLEAKRAEFRKKEWPMAAARLMLAHAQEIGLGNADADRIDVVEAKMG
ncbi:MAG: DUF362 domain-containing protein [Planctomycetes bacterium]|nr:DUF362 domain-containing protein [Planctomycetota bacterium]